MQNYPSANLIVRSSTIKSNAVKKQMNYFNPKGASNRQLPLNCRKALLEIAAICSRQFTNSISPERPEYSKSPNRIYKRSKRHKDLANSTKVLGKLKLLSSKEGSPIRLAQLPTTKIIKDLTQQSSLPRLYQITDIVTSCEKISKLNKSDILIANDLLKENHRAFKKVQKFVDDRRNAGNGQK